MLGRLPVVLALAASRVHGAITAGSIQRHSLVGVETEKRESVLLQEWGTALDEASSTNKITPVRRVVNLLKDMQATLQKEMDEDEALYKKMGCWCNNNKYEKDASITTATSKIAELESTISGSAAKSSELKERLDEINGEVAAAKKALAESEKLRKRQAQNFHQEEIEAVEAIENLKAAIMVLERKSGSAFPQLDLSLLYTGSRHKDIPWEEDHESRLQRSFGDFMRNSGLSDAAPLSPESRALIDDMTSGTPAATHFLQNEGRRPAPAVAAGEWSSEEKATVRRAMKSASSFMQRKHGGSEYQQSLGSSVGEILGVLKQLKDEMEENLRSSRSAEVDAAATANEMMSAKKAELENGEKQNERLEDQLADTKNTLAEAKEDLDQTNAALSADQKFMINLEKMCKDSDAGFEERKKARLEEITAVSQTMEILTADDAKDTLSANYNFLQTSQFRADVRRQQAAAILRKVRAPELSVLATSVELDSFTRVKKAIDDMIAQLKTQQADEVKKSDWCKAEFRSNEMSQMKATSTKGGLEAKIGDLESNLEKLTDELVAAKKEIAQLQLDLQRGTETRKQANMDFQRSVADQRATQEILKKALDKLAKFYDFAQTKVKHASSEAQSGMQTPPVPEMEYEKNKGASGVMSMIEKLIYEAQHLEKEAIDAEAVEQRQYEELVTDTNDSVAALQKLIVTKTSEESEAKKEKIDADSDLKDTLGELAGLAKYEADLHGDCDYLLKNFDTRQEARSQEVEALQQAKSILSGATAR
jgi:chromosome segregation ATPase